MAEAPTPVLRTKLLAAPIRKIATAAGLGPTRVHAIVRDAELDGLDAALGELRSLYGWPGARGP